MTTADLIARLHRESNQLGSQAKLAQAIGITPSYLSDVLLGKREPGPKILAYLQLAKKTIYEPITEPSK